MGSTGTTTVIDAARRALGPVGVTLPVSFTTPLSIDLQREAVRRMERVGYHAVWTNEVIGGKDALVQLAVLLSATERLAFGTSIANIWARQPQTMHGAAAVLAQAHPGRFVLGLGSATRSRRPTWARSSAARWPPCATTWNGWPPDPAARARRRRSPDHRRERSEDAGAGRRDRRRALPPYSPEFTAQARQVLGPDKLLVVGLSVVPDSDRDRARAIARERVSAGLGQPSYAAGLTRLGYSDQDIAEVSDRLVDAIIAHGDPAAIAAKVREHLTAGADHVTLLSQVGTDFSVGVDQLE
ncbi:LLM class flavin-dependent oxidoreductase [Streptomyces mirabilis]|nr:LLM class flavin-dependent oxidoreductase [Streptomyces mirabilis]